MSINNLKKHSGILINTGVRVAVVFRKLPNDTENCLIVEIERLPDAYHDQLLQILNSKDAAETNDLYEVLNKRSFPDGINCLSALHQRGFIRKEPVLNIMMIPLPGKSVPLSLINATIDKTVDQYMADEAKPLPADLSPLAKARELFNESKVYENKAKDLRAKAYALDPNLKGVGRNKLTEDEHLAAIERNKEKRKERDLKKKKTPLDSNVASA